jgi:uncharacterized protein (DUF58 family)
MAADMLKLLGQSLIAAGDSLENGSEGGLPPGFVPRERGGSGFAAHLLQRGAEWGSSVVTVPVSGSAPAPLWLFPVASAPALVFAALWVRRRTFPSVQLSGALYDVATLRGPSPPVLQPLLRVATMLGLAGALLASRWLDPLLLASTLLLLSSLLLAIRRPFASRWAQGLSERLLRHRPLAVLAAALAGGSSRRWVSASAMGLASLVLLLALAGVLGEENRLPLAAAALLILSGLTLWEILPRPAGDTLDWESVLGRAIGLAVVGTAPRAAAAPPAPGAGSFRPGSFDMTLPRLNLGGSGGPHLVAGGHDPEDRREYAAGDDIRAIDWRATARTGKMYTKMSAPDAESSMWLAVDCSASTHSGLEGEKRDHMARLASLLARSASLGDHRFGLALFTTGLEKVVQPQVGKGQSERVANALAAHAPREAGTDLPRALEGLGHHLRGPGTIFLISDFTEEPPPEFEAAVQAFRSRGQKLVAVRVVDPLDEELPDLGVACIENPETGSAKLVNTSDARLHRDYRAAARELQVRLRRRLDRLDVPLIEVRTTEAPRRLLDRVSRMGDRPPARPPEAPSPRSHGRAGSQTFIKNVSFTGTRPPWHFLSSSPPPPRLPPSPSAASSPSRS